MKKWQKVVAGIAGTALLLCSALVVYASTIRIGANTSLDVGPGQGIIGGNFHIMSGILKAGPNSYIGVEGDWDNRGGFQQISSTVEFLEGAPIAFISSSTMFFNLKASTTIAIKTLIFEENMYQRVQNNLDLQGAPGALLEVFGNLSTPRGKIGLTSTATQTISYIDVKNMEARGQDIAFGSPTSYFSVDSGNNLGWFETINPINPPTVISLISFIATTNDSHILLSWATASEIDNAGFNLLQKEDDGEYEQINAELIPAEGSPTSGVRYSYEDFSVYPERDYSYILEDVDLYGVVTQHKLGPIAFKGFAADSPQVATATMGGAEAESKDDGGCFIATAAFGSYLDPHVWTLRQFRDNFLLTNSIGSKFVDLYYEYSPPLADYIAKHDTLRSATRVALIPLVGFGSFMVNTSLLVKLMTISAIFTAAMVISLLYVRSRREEECC